MSLTTGGLVEWVVKLQLGDADAIPQVMLWDVGRWDVDAWGASGDAYMTDVSASTLRFTTARGRQRYTGRFRSGYATIVLDNTDGRWTPAGGATQPGFLPLRPGRRVQIFARYNGAEIQVYEGFVDTFRDTYARDGSLRTTITAIDLFANAAAANTVAQASQGAGEASSARIRRILANAFTEPPWVQTRGVSNGEPIDTKFFGVSMLATTLAQDALTELQITSDSEGGGIWVNPDGSIAFALSEYFRDKVDSGLVDWQLGAAGIGLYAVEDPDWSMSRIVNESHYARAGGSEQVASNSASIGVYGLRTHRRLDLQTDDDAHVAYLGSRIVSLLATDRQRIDGLTLQPDNPAEILAGLTADIGDVALVTIPTIRGWSYTTKSQLFGISHRVDPERWRVAFTIDDTEIADQGGYSSGFSAAFDVT